MGICAVQKFLEGRRVLYGAPTIEQVGRFWTTVTRALQDPINSHFLSINKSEHFIEVAGTENRIKAKTAWNADSLRGDYADVLILDEFQLMSEDAWNTVGAPMLLDNDGDAVFIYTPPSLHSRSISKASDKQHAAKMYNKFKMLQQEGNPRFGAFHFTSMANPYISEQALGEITQDMSNLAYRMEILAEDINEAPGALWTRGIIESSRVLSAPELRRVVIGVDPSATAMGDETGIIAAGVNGEGYVLGDYSLQGSPLTWAKAAIQAYYMHKADRIVAESNQGGEMVETTIHQVDPSVPVTLIHASRGKATRAEPISAQYEKGRVHHVGTFNNLEDELCIWTPGDKSPNRLDACVHALSQLMLQDGLGLFNFMAGQNDQREARLKEAQCQTPQ